ncbi:MAG: M23 family metallopeptidase [Clostridia bacterium]|nr:M23 family metallopeptidase [Clostridia bacterium]
MKYTKKWLAWLVCVGICLGGLSGCGFLEAANSGVGNSLVENVSSDKNSVAGSDHNGENVQSNGGEQEDTSSFAEENSSEDNVSADVNSGEEGSLDENKPYDMGAPLATISVSKNYGYAYNQTTGVFENHNGVDFSAEVGASVFAVADGIIESISDDILNGSSIVIDHGNGLKSVYYFVTAAEMMTVGGEVTKGNVIATVAEVGGSEYKDGAHLHFEILKDGVVVDPTDYLTFLKVLPK